MLELLIATRNKGKVKEFKELLKNKQIQIKSLDDFDNVKEVQETGKTFAENAKLKARLYAIQTNCWTLADDSGLEVEALNNAPGIFSARYAGEKSSDKENNLKLLSELKKSKSLNRNARFVCNIVVSNALGETQFVAHGTCQGKIAILQKGTNGFGYDSLFIPNDFEQTFGELSSKIKEKISHRSQALKKIMHFFDKNMYS